MVVTNPYMSEEKQRHKVAMDSEWVNVPRWNALAYTGRYGLVHGSDRETSNVRHYAHIIVLHVPMHDISIHRNIAAPYMHVLRHVCTGLTGILGILQHCQFAINTNMHSSYCATTLAAVAHTLQRVVWT